MTEGLELMLREWQSEHANQSNHSSSNNSKSGNNGNTKKLIKITRIMITIKLH